LTLAEFEQYSDLFRASVREAYLSPLE
jgi:hypothetical protein